MTHTAVTELMQPTSEPSKRARTSAGSATSRVLGRAAAFVALAALAVPAHARASTETHRLPDGHMLTTVTESTTAAAAEGLDSTTPLLDSAMQPEKSPNESAELICTISGAAPTTSACGENSFQAGFEEIGKAHGKSTHALLQFSLPSLETNALVLNAKLELYETKSSAKKEVTMDLSRIVTPWSNGATWETTDGTTPWKSPGGDYVPPSQGSPIENKAIGSKNGWKTWYPTEIVQSWLNGAAAPRAEGSNNLGILLRDEEEFETSNIVTFDGSTSTKAPVLSFEWIPRGVGNESAYILLPTKLSNATTLNVNAASGNLLIETKDLGIASRGYEFEVARTFNSLAPQEPGYGAGWTDDNAEHVTVEADGSLAYVNSSGATYLFTKIRNSFIPPPGIEAGICEKGSTKSGKHYCPTSLPSGVTYELEYTKTGRKVFFAGTSGTIYTDYNTNTAEETHTAHYTKGYVRPSSWTDSAESVIDYEQTKAAGYTAVKFPAGSESAEYVEKADPAGEQKLLEFTNKEGKVTKYLYGTGTEEGLVTEIAEPGSPRAIITYDKEKRVASVEEIQPGQPSGPKVTYTYYAAGHAPLPCNEAQTATAVKQPEGTRVIFCTNSLDEVERSAHEARLGIGPSTPLDFSGFDQEVPVDINVANGNAIVQSEDVELPNGTDVFVGRTLNTMSSTPSDIGPSWQENWGPDTRLEGEATGAWVFTDPGGYRETFKPTGSGTYEAEHPSFGTLRSVAGGWILATAAGYTYTFNVSGELTAYEDQTEGRFEPTYTTINGKARLATIKEPGGGLLQAKYNEDGLLTELASSDGQSISYEYTGGWESGIWLLAKMKSSITGDTTAITYNPVTWMASEVTLTGGHVTKLYYDPFGRVSKIEQTDAGASTPVVTNISYSAPTAAECEPSDVGETTVTGGEEGGEELYCWNGKGELTNPHETD